MRQIFQNSKSAQILGNSDSSVLEVFHRVLDEHATPLLFVFAGTCVPLVFSSGGRSEKAGSISGALETP